MARFDPADAPELLRAAREDAGMSQSELASRARIAQSNLAAVESGRRPVSAEMLERLLAAADYRPTVALRRARTKILREAPDYGVRGVAVFGSLLRGQDHFDSDIDLILDVDQEASTLVGYAFAARVEELTGFPVDSYARYSAEESEFGRRMLEKAVPL